jgi:arylsulfatase
MSSPNESLQREILPIPDISLVGLTTCDARDPDTKFPPFTPLRPPASASSVLIIRIDDWASAPPAPLAGRASRPTLSGWQPTDSGTPAFHHRALLAHAGALLTGRNHHSVGPTPRPACRDPESERLQHGADRQMPRNARGGNQPEGPHRQWPTGQGFEYFYGFLGAETSR